MPVESITPVTPRPLRWPALVQQWRDLAFVHWPVDPAQVAGLLPAGTHPDTLDGVTYVGLVPFRMYRVRLPALPSVPYVGTFCETNIRLYSVDDDGRRGVAFRSLDAARLLPVLIGRIGACLPYTWSRMRVSREGDVLTYTSQRRWPCWPGSPGSPGSLCSPDSPSSSGPRGANRTRIAVEQAIPQPTRLEQFLTARWGLHVRWYGRTLYLPNEHETWPLYRARLLEVDDGLVAAGGLPQPTTAPVSVLYSPGVSVRFGMPSSVSAT